LKAEAAAVEGGGESDIGMPSTATIETGVCGTGQAEWVYLTCLASYSAHGRDRERESSATYYCLLLVLSLHS
jgi:hypothetical protein